MSQASSHPTLQDALGEFTGRDLGDMVVYLGKFITRKLQQLKEFCLRFLWSPDNASTPGRAEAASQPPSS